jgi:glutamate formiminotransferase/formiminotetrahydrofolate cyclodeaminase
VPDDLAPGERFGDLTLAAFVDRLASSDPVPGGGSASAVAAGLGAALVAMVASLSQDRPRYAAHAALHARAIDRGQALADRLLDLADTDAAAYAGYSAAMKLPRETDDERAIRGAAIQRAARAAAEVPMETVEACLEVVALAEALAGRSNMNAASDLNVAAMLGEAAARGAAENVIVNLPAVGDEAYAAEATIRVKLLLDDVETLARTTREAVLGGDVREPLVD